MSEIEKLRRDNTKLKEALEFYANENNWVFHSTYFDAYDDRGMLARTTLMEVDTDE